MALQYSEIRQFLGLINVLLSVLVGYLFYSIAVALYNVTLHPLAKIPGPKLRGAFYFEYYWEIWTGNLVVNSRALHDRYGSTVRTSPSTVSFSNSEAWQDIYVDRQGRKAIPKDKKMYINTDGIADIITSGDADHARMRRLLSHAFSKSALYEQESLQNSYYDTLIKKLYAKIDGPNKGKVNLVHWFNFTTFDLIGDLCFGESFDALKNEEYNFWISQIFKWFKLGRVIVIMTAYPLITAPILYLFFRFPSLEKSKQKHAQYTIDKSVRRLERRSERNDFMSYILRHNDEKGMTREEIIKLNTNLIIGGSEPVATVLCGAVFYLLKNPQALKRLTAEIRTAFTDPADMTYSKLEDVQYLNACLREALRIYPPIPFLLPRRTLPGGAVINGYLIPGNVRVGIPPWSTFHLQDNFADPDQYIPERWLDDPRFANDKRSVLQPFSVGRRNCLGQHLARAQMRAILARMVWHFDIVLTKESENWDNQKVYMLWEKPDLVVQLKRRF